MTLPEPRTAAEMVERYKGAHDRLWGDPIPDAPPRRRDGPYEMWPVEREEQLRDLWLNTRKSAAVIASILGGGLSRSAVLGKVLRLNLQRPEPVPPKISALGLCPCCGAKMKEPPPVGGLLFANLTAKERSVLAMLVEAYPAVVQTRSLIMEIWQYQPDGGPLKAENGVSVFVHKIRRKIAPMGWTIMGGSKIGGRRLQFVGVVDGG